MDYDIDERPNRGLWIGLMAAMALPLGVITWIVMSPGQGELSGRVLFSGKPVTVGSVVVLAADGSIRTAPIESNGRYRLAGVPRGPAKVGVVSRDPAKVSQRYDKMLKPSDRLTDEDRAGVAKPAKVLNWFPVPDKFADPKYSGLETVVLKSASYDIVMR